VMKLGDSYIATDTGMESTQESNSTDWTGGPNTATRCTLSRVLASIPCRLVLVDTATGFDD
jgi:hypothetical protein